jgi:hypothetical protein
MTFLNSLNLEVFPNSLVTQNDVEFALVKTQCENQLAILSKSNMPDFDGQRTEVSGSVLYLCALTPNNARSLRTHLMWLRPQPLGLSTSAGMGDRLGLATPGHVRALRKVGGNIAPIFAQQSIRENSRTGRNPQQVLDDATWGMFQEGWQGGCGADADHLKTVEDIDSCFKCGYSFFTIDPGDYVDNRAGSNNLSELRELSATLPKRMSVRASGLSGKKFEIENLSIIFDEITLLKAAVKYGKAIDHVVTMYQHLTNIAGSFPFEFEVSVDETDQPTTHAEHVYIASELKRFGVEWVSLAPRYIGRFEKGVDYIGSLAVFETDFAGHAAIARHFGPYKLSLHSGSDKFSIYPIANRLTHGLVHLKTAGTSYLEALRTIASIEPDFFREIYTFGRERYENDRLSYHVSAELDHSPLPSEINNWPDLLDQFDAREILHVTFGSVLTDRKSTNEVRFYDHLMDILRTNPETYAGNLESHFAKHLTPFLPSEGWKNESA